MGDGSDGGGMGSDSGGLGSDSGGYGNDRGFGSYGGRDGAHTATLGTVTVRAPADPRGFGSGTGMSSGGRARPGTVGSDKYGIFIIGADGQKIYATSQGTGESMYDLAPPTPAAPGASGSDSSPTTSVTTSAPAASYSLASPTSSWGTVTAPVSAWSDFGPTVSSFSASEAPNESLWDKVRTFMNNPVVGALASLNPVTSTLMGVYQGVNALSSGNVGQGVMGLAGLFGASPAATLGLGMAADAVAGNPVNLGALGRYAGSTMGAQIGQGFTDSPLGAIIGSQVVGGLLGNIGSQVNIANGPVDNGPFGISANSTMRDSMLGDYSLGGNPDTWGGIRFDGGSNQMGFGTNYGLDNGTADTWGTAKGSLADMVGSTYGNVANMANGAGGADWLTQGLGTLGGLWAANKMSKAGNFLNNGAFQQDMQRQLADLQQQYQDALARYSRPINLGSPGFRQTNLDALRAKLGEMYSTEGAIGQELEQMLARKDAAIGRRSQYGPRSAQLLAELTRLRSQYEPNYLAQYINADNQYNQAALAGWQGRAQAAMASRAQEIGLLQDMFRTRASDIANQYNSYNQNAQLQYQSNLAKYQNQAKILNNALEFGKQTGLLNYAQNYLSSLFA